MAKYIQGINGIFIGKVGTVVGCVWKGIPYMRSKGKPRSSQTTEIEAKNRSKFATAHAWLQPLLVFLRTGFADYSATTVGFNAAKSYNLKNAMIQGEVVPDLVKVSYGDLPLPETLEVALLEDKLQVNWSTGYIPGTSDKDQLMLLAYHPESRTALYEVHGAFRSMGTQLMDTYSEFVGKTIHIYAAFVAADRSKQSTSLYLGAIDC
jgi:hypothetical protein